MAGLSALTAITVKNHDLHWFKEFRNHDQTLRCRLGRILRVADTRIDCHAMVENAAGICIGTEAPFAVIFAYPGIADATKLQFRHQRLNRARCRARR